MDSILFDIVIKRSMAIRKYHGTDNKVQTIVMIEWEMTCKFERYGS